MTDTNQNQPKQILLTGLLLLLVVIVGIQAWYMVDMKEQLNVIHKQQMGVQPVTNSSIKAAPVRKPPVLNQAAAQPSQQQVQPKNQPQARTLFDDDFFNSSPYDAQAWNPYEEIQRMQRDMDRMFNNAFSRFNSSPDFQHLFREGFTTPEMDVQEDDVQYTVIVDLPGSNEDNVSVNLDGQTLTVKGEQKYEKQDKDSMGNVIFQERRSGSFQRSITLPGPVKQSGMKTEISNGVLTITIPKDV